ncbi:MAG: hypothetical protein Q8O55_11190 [Dehalococcoidales bacterium]|nr:hypothetical protein [Dehalococcoidales bacterium]
MMAITMTELKSKQASGELSQGEYNAVLDTKRKSALLRQEVGDLLSKRKRSIKSRPRRKPDQTKPEYAGLTGAWASYYDVTSRYESHIPVQDRDDWRHDTMLELEKAEARDGKPLPDLKAYRIASLMIALYFRNLNRYAQRVCIVNGYATEPHCRSCQSHTESRRCAWLAVRPVERLDGEVIDPDGYRVKLLDTVAIDRVEDMPERWYDLKKLTQALPPRLVEIAYKKREHKSLSDADRKYLYRYQKTKQKALF